MMKDIKCEINCQKGKRICAEFPLNSKKYEKDGIQIQVTERVQEGCRFGNLFLHIKNTSNTENFNLRMERPLRLYIPTERPEKMTALYLYNEWWTRPAFIDCFQEIPDRTQVLFMKYTDCCVCIVPMVGTNFKTLITEGTDNELCLEMAAGLGGQSLVNEPLYLIAEAPGIYEAIHKAFSWLADYKGIRLREERRIPEMFRYLGWCSWDAFYRDVSESGVRKKADELSKNHVPIKWIVIDDGWMKTKDELLCDFEPDSIKFPEGFRKLTDELKEKYGIRWVGVWHTIGGFWGGIAPESELAVNESPYLYQTVGGKLLPSPLSGQKFYRNWYEKLNRDGIQFVKVDGQSSIACYFENSLPIAKAASGMNEALESGSSRMDGAVINCMGMAMENILARPVTAISRNSDDFIPDKEDGFSEHLLQNAFNALYHNELYCCDWDMFWTIHKDAVKHSLLRAISGGPVYISDRIDATDPSILKPLTYMDGEVLMMDRSAKPTEDCVFSNPLAEGALKLQNISNYGGKKAGGIAVFNLTDKEQFFSFCPADISGLEQTEHYWIYDYFSGDTCFLCQNEKYVGDLKTGDYGWFVILPNGKNGTCLGLLDKYVGFTAVEYICENENMMSVVIRESGRVGWISEKTPFRVTINGKDYTEKYKRNEKVYVVDFPESDSKMMLSIIWDVVDDMNTGNKSV